MKNLAAIIPARGGSKGIPKKNISIIDGKPLVDYTIEFAKSLGIEVYLTSDSDEILERGNINSIHCIKRPDELATDSSVILDTLLHAAKVINSEEEKIDSFIVLQPTFLIRDLGEVKSAINSFKLNNYESLVAVTRMTEHPCWCIDLNEDSKEWEYLVKPPKGETNRQKFKNTYFFINGNFYITKISSLEKNKGYFHQNTHFSISEERYNIDIDYPQDLEFAKSQIYRLKKNI